MPSPLSVDLRERVVAAVTEGASFHRAAARFDVSVSSASRWSARFAQEGHVAPNPTHSGDRLSGIEAQADLILSTYEARPEIFLRELRDVLAARGVTTSTSGLSRFFARHGISRKKGLFYAAEQERADVKAERQAWFDAMPDLDPDTLVFLDETAAATNMARRYGRAPRGERCRLLVPQGHYKTTTVTAALRTTGLCALSLMDGATNGQRFRSYVADNLVPVLQAGDTVILDNLQAHKVAGVREAIEAVGARVLYLPPYSPDFNPIEQIFAKLKQMLRTAAARTVPDLWATIREAFTGFTSDECRNCLTAAGYENDLAVAT
ncbi:IS630 family transposase [Methylobacterium sp. J-026]|uniref:IS630 family transposase n=1 Tax=Methylobacterium sp. J-026 TaxID=2836624 RepID=UPI001FBABB87|nr:IS630 family transposase [Methylobacterium sp. J-026]MCJ2135793.1 IS630 family transposase [Methylobacterium sp. J-026]